MKKKANKQNAQTLRQDAERYLTTRGKISPEEIGYLGMLEMFNALGFNLENND